MTEEKGIAVSRKKLLAFLVVILVCSLSVAGYVIYTMYFTYDVRIAFLTKDIHHLPLIIAIKKGWFEEYGIKAVFYEYPNGMAEMTAFGSNEIDMGYLGIAPALNKRLNEGIRVIIVAAVNVNGSAIVVARNLGINSLEDLKNKLEAGGKIAHPGWGTVQHFLLTRALTSVGMSVDRINKKSVPMRPGDMEVKLHIGEIVGFIAWEPFCAKAVVEGGAKYLILSGEIWKNHPCCVIAVHENFYREHPDIVRKVLEIHVKAVEWIKEHFEEAVKIAVEWTGMSEDVVRLALQNVAYIYVPDVGGIKEYLELLINYEYIKNPPENVDAFLNEFINTTILESLVGE
ncbi:MAG: ABC transporter substrate-binding protein [Candidatus Baldrarchaeia archaeon]